MRIVDFQTPLNTKRSDARHLQLDHIQTLTYGQQINLAQTNRLEGHAGGRAPLGARPRNVLDVPTRLAPA